MTSRSYQLSFISDHDLFAHVKNTVEKYRIPNDFTGFTHNMLDPIKLTFDSQIYQLPIDKLIQNELLRQIDKSNTNHIGYFHQNIFQYFDPAWQIPKQGFDLIHPHKHLFIEIKNKHNTMNSASSQKIYNQMQQKILEDDQATCYLVEVISRKSQDTPWRISLNGKPRKHNRIRRISIDRFYHLVTHEPHAFYQLCRVLPQVVADVLAEDHSLKTLPQDLHDLPTINHLSDLYKLSFNHYIGFQPILFQGDFYDDQDK